MRGFFINTRKMAKKRQKKGGGIIKRIQKRAADKQQGRADRRQHNRTGWDNRAERKTKRKAARIKKREDRQAFKLKKKGMNVEKAEMRNEALGQGLGAAGEVLGGLFNKGDRNDSIQSTEASSQFNSGTPRFAFDGSGANISANPAQGMNEVAREMGVPTESEREASESAADKKPMIVILVLAAVVIMFRKKLFKSK